MIVRCREGIKIDGRDYRAGETAEVPLSAAKVLAEMGMVEAAGSLGARLLESRTQGEMERAAVRAGMGGAVECTARRHH